MNRQSLARQQRMDRLSELAKQHGVIKASDLAKRLGITERSVYRYVDELQQAGAPIVGARGSSKPVGYRWYGQQEAPTEEPHD